MARYLAKVRSTLQQFTEWTIEKIKRADNRHADALAGIAAPSHQEAILLPYMCKPIPLSQKIPLATPLRQTKRMIKNGRMILQNISGQALYPKILNKHKIRVQAARFTLMGAPVQAILHRALSSLSWAFRGPKDAAAYVQKCDKCQRYAPIPHMPSAALKSVSGPWPFAQWGMDIVGPLPAAPAQKKFLLVATDYFSKWVEAEAYASIKDKDVTKFHCIQEFLFGIEYPEFILHATLSSKQWQAEATNKTLINALKKRLEQAKGKWVEELPGVLWAYRTTPGTNRKHSFCPHIWNGCSHSH
ncbi:hypothetical protein CK203_035897 [Vitis vinifera]|uniref:Integrase zinc-binding domain-containing protein n=1 Tax=Vitis vinifera TaxID=29760 RepID=A0A438HZV4_VITVI|nr:hypothetical protein CK203_035897 [Vitis vinifera]